MLWFLITSILWSLFWRFVIAIVATVGVGMFLGSTEHAPDAFYYAAQEPLYSAGRVSGLLVTCFWLSVLVSAGWFAWKRRAWLLPLVRAWFAKIRASGKMQERILMAYWCVLVIVGLECLVRAYCDFGNHQMFLIWLGCFLAFEAKVRDVVKSLNSLDEPKQPAKKQRGATVRSRKSSTRSSRGKGVI